MQFYYRLNKPQSVLSTRWMMHWCASKLSCNQWRNDVIIASSETASRQSWFCPHAAASLGTAVGCVCPRMHRRVQLLVIFYVYDNNNPEAESTQQMTKAIYLRQLVVEWLVFKANWMDSGLKSLLAFNCRRFNKRNCFSCLVNYSFRLGIMLF